MCLRLNNNESDFSIRVWKLVPGGHGSAQMVLRLRPLRSATAGLGDHELTSVATLKSTTTLDAQATGGWRVAAAHIAWAIPCMHRGACNIHRPPMRSSSIGRGP